MPKVKSNLSRLSSRARRAASSRNDETEEQREQRLSRVRSQVAVRRQKETDSEREARLSQDSLRLSLTRRRETSLERNNRIHEQVARTSENRAAELDSERENRSTDMRARTARDRDVSTNPTHELRSAFHYDPAINYADHCDVQIGKMDKVCRHCNAKKWHTETASMCCGNGKVRLQEYLDPPEPIRGLLHGDNQHSKHFLENARKYNSAFQMTSFGAKDVREGNLMPTFKVQGQVYHSIGSLLSAPDANPKFLQIYFISEADQVSLLQNTIPGLRRQVVEDLQQMLHANNSYIRSFKSALDQNVRNEHNFNLLIYADRRPTAHHRGRYNAPTINEVAVLMVDEDCGHRDIVLRSHDDRLKRVSEVHRSYDALQYPLMFVRGENGYSIDIPQTIAATGAEDQRKTVSCMMFYAYRLMVRENSVNHLHYFRQLFNQFCVDMMAKIITERLNFIRNHQQTLRAEDYIHLRDAINDDANPADIGNMVILPSSFTGSPRYLHERTQDAMTYVRTYGKPDSFITFTCNPEWPEIKNELFPGQRSSDRHDIVSRVFQLKVKKMMDLITKGGIFGATRCYMYTIEWQKWGLPHAHILIWLQEKIRPDRIDDIISAEFPVKEDDPLLFDIISKNMVHGPCGEHNNQSPCMVNGKCSKRYPRDFLQETQTGDDGYPKYRRRSPEDGGFSGVINQRTGIVVDNRWVVPHPPMLCRVFNAHINVEFCNSVKAIKYICKYINKGSDLATFSVQNNADEITNYLNGRYISTSEAVWRIFSFSIHERYPTVTHLAVHLENGQRVYFSSANLQQVIQNPPSTTLTAFFSLCSRDDFAKTLLYCEVPSYYTWTNKTWNRRKRGQDVDGYPGVKKDTALGRVYTIHPNYSECFYLRILLHHIRGPTSFNFLRIINGVAQPTYQAACQASGLLENDDHWDDTLCDATISESSARLRDLFAIMLIFCQISDPQKLWDKYKTSLCEDILHRYRRQESDIDIQMNDEMFNEGLILIEDKILMLGDKHLTDFNSPEPRRDTLRMNNLQYLRELSYNIDDLGDYVRENENKLVVDQRVAYDTILQSVNDNEGKVFFLDAPGGTGKTFLINLILAKIRAAGNIAVAVASSGIAATLLSGGKTAHSTFKLPINITQQETAVCSIRKNGAIAKILQESVLVVWDECTMTRKVHIEAVNRTLKDIRSSPALMGGLTFVFSGDFRQTLPVIAKGTQADTVKACLKSTPIWQQVEKLKLSTNMRVHLRGDQDAENFANLLLQIGDGSAAESDGFVKIDNALGVVLHRLVDMISQVYPDLENLPKKDFKWLCERAIVTPKNSSAEEINDMVMTKINTESKVYKSIDTVVNIDEAVHYPTEFLNSLSPSGLPPHRLNLRVSTPIMLLRNLNPPQLCNGTRLQIKSMRSNIIEATILTGPAAGETAFIPRIPMIPSDLPFQFKRLQFPIKTCFAMTINKAQGQSFNVVGVDLRSDCFAHGQLYVGLSRIGNSSHQFILLPENRITRNIVYREIL